MQDDVVPLKEPYVDKSYIIRNEIRYVLLPALKEDMKLNVA